MTELFDGYRYNYNRTVEQSIGFSGLKHDFFLKAKTDLIESLIEDRGLRSGGDTVRALDVGCGVGALHPYLQPLLPGLQACDISSESIARARQDNPWVNYAAYGAEARLPYDAGGFDLAFAVCVVHHVPPARWSAFMAEMFRVVRRGGVVCIIEHNPFNPLTRLAVLRCPFDEDAVLLGHRKAARLMAEAGFSEVESRHFLLFPFAGRVARRIEGWMSPLPVGAQYACSGRV